MEARLIVAGGFGYNPTQDGVTFTSITRFVDVESGVSVGRGASDELSEVQPGSCSLTLDNSDGRFTPGNSGSPYYPYVRANTPIRVLVQTSDKNLILQPAFESGISPWFSSGTPTLSQDTTRAWAGTKALQIAFGNASDQCARTRVYGLDIGETYTASAYVWIPAGTADAGIGLVNIPGGATTTLKDQWVRLTHTFTATDTQHLLSIGALGVSATTGMQMWVDAVQVEEGPTATTYDPNPAVHHNRFYGMINEWPTRWDGLYSHVTVTCSDLFKWLNRIPELQPMLVEEMQEDQPVAHYPMGEPAESTTCGDISGNGAGALEIMQTGSGGTIEFGAGGGPTDSLGCPKFTPASATAGKYLRAALGVQATSTLNANPAWFVEAWFSTSTTGANILCLSSADFRQQITVSLQTSGYLRVNWVADGVEERSVVAAPGNFADGAVHHLVLDMAAHIAYVDGVQIFADFAVKPIADPAYLYVGARPAAVIVADSGTSNLWAGTLAQVAIYTSATTNIADILANYTTSTGQRIGEPAHERMGRIASYVGLPVIRYGAAFDGMAAQTALGSSPLSHMQDIARTEGGRLFASRDDAKLIFQSRDLRYNPTVAITLPYADLETDEIEFANDDQKMCNIITATRPGGATQRVINQTSVTAYGPYEQTVELLKQTDVKVLDAANWHISRYADPPSELRQVPVEAYSLGLTTYRALLDADISTAIQITDMPAQAPTSTAIVNVEGYTETIWHNRHAITFHTSSAQTDSVWVLDNASYSQLGKTTRLAY